MRALVTIVSLSLLLVAAPARAQVESRALYPLERNLEQALKGHEYEQFGSLLTTAASGQELLRTATRMRERVLSGDGAFMVRAYAGALWRVTAGANVAGVRESAAVMVVYLNSLIVLDGLKCQDRSAAPERLQQISAETRPVLDHMRTLPKDRQEFVLETAFRLEEKLAAVRADDDWICRAGMQAMLSALKKGDRAQQVPTTPGGLGKTFQVPPDPDFAPVFRDRKDWEAEQTARRPQLRAAMRASLLEAAK